MEDSTNEADEKLWYFSAATFKERAFQPYVLAIGRSALAWNSLQEEFGSLFWALIGGGLSVTPMAIWQALKVDRPKRDMLMRTVENMPKPFYETFPEAKAEIAWVINEANKLEDARNNAIHAPLQLTAPLSAFKKFGPKTSGKQRREVPPEATVVPLDWQLNERAKRIAGKHILTEYRWCHDATIVLRDYVVAIIWALRSEDSPWPERPKLPNRGRSSGK